MGLLIQGVEATIMSEEQHYYTKEPQIHSHIEDGLPDEHPLAGECVYCAKCNAMVHANNNECMQTWIETEFGNYCSLCFEFSDHMEFLEENLALAQELKKHFNKSVCE